MVTQEDVLNRKFERVAVEENVVVVVLLGGWSPDQSALGSHTMPYRPEPDVYGFTIWDIALFIRLL